MRILSAQHLLNGHARNVRHRLRHEFLGYDKRFLLLLGCPCFICRLELRLRLHLALTAQGCTIEVSGVDATLLLLPEKARAYLVLAHRVGQYALGHAQSRSRLVNRIDRLVGQLPSGLITLRQANRCRECRRRVAHVVMLRVLLGDALKDLHRLFGRRLLHQNRLEATLQRVVLFDALAVFPERGCTDALKLTTRQRGLDDVRRVHRALGSTGSNDGMQFVKEEDHVSALRDFLNNALEPLLELPAILRPGNEQRHIQRDHSLLEHTQRNVPANNQLRQAFHDRRLSNARFANQDRVILPAPAQNLQQPMRLFLAPDYGVKLARLRQLRQVSPKGFQRRSRVLLLRILLRRRGRHSFLFPVAVRRFGHILLGEQLLDRLLPNVHLHEKLRATPLPFRDDCQKQTGRRNLLHPASLRNHLRHLADFQRTWRPRQRLQRHGIRHATRGHKLLQPRHQIVMRYIRPRQDDVLRQARHHATRQHNVLRAHVVMMQLLRFKLCLTQDKHRI